jgi:hypothetical protein
MTVLLQNQLQTWSAPLFGPILVNLPEFRPQIFLASRNFFGPFCVLRPKFCPLGNTGILALTRI